MKASEAKSGSKYLSRTSIPVTVKGTKNGKVLLRLETTGTTIAVNGEYELKPLTDALVNKDVATSLTKRIKVKAEVKTAVVSTSLSAHIDPLLLAGGRNVKEIAAEVLKHSPELAKGKDVEANIRARMVSYTRKGWQITKDADKRVQLLPPKA